MKVSRHQVAENRGAILEAAARLFRERGFDDVSVAEVMTAAGLTHGGFYGHFRSKDDLAAQASAQALASDPDAPRRSLSDHVVRYLRSAHRDNRAQGCGFAALGVDAARQSKAVRRAMTAGLTAKLEVLTATAPGDTREARRHAAISAFAGMVGALILARMVDDAALSDEILAETKASLTGRTDAPSPQATPPTPVRPVREMPQRDGPTSNVQETFGPRDR